MRVRKKRGGPVETRGLRTGLCVVFLLSAVFIGLTSALLGSGDPRLELVSLQLPFLFGARPLPKAVEEYEIPLTVDYADIDEDVSDSFRVELLTVTEHSGLDLSGQEPRILIYHTHATEAYRQVKGEEYEESSDWRTLDDTRSIISVGAALAETLQKEYGISVLHDATNHEPPKLSTSYSRSVKTMERYQKDYPSITMYIDVHRDAYGTSDSGKNDFVVIDGKEVARLMFVVGTGEGATGTGFGDMPDFQSNYALAKHISEYLNEIQPGLARNIRVKTGRYNQHISNQCLLVEVGHNANTLSQAHNAVAYLAEAIAHSAGISSAPTGAHKAGEEDILQLAP